MTEYRVAFMPRATDELRYLDKKTAQRILHKIKWLSQNFGGLAPEKLGGELKGFYKLRIGSCRIVYTADREEYLLTVHLIGRRRDIHRH